MGILCTPGMETHKKKQLLQLERLPQRYLSVAVCCYGKWPIARLHYIVSIFLMGYSVEMDSLFFD